MIPVVDYDPYWSERFQALRDEYASALDAAGVPVIGIGKSYPLGPQAVVAEGCSAGSLGPISSGMSPPGQACHGCLRSSFMPW